MVGANLSIKEIHEAKARISKDIINTNIKTALDIKNEIRYHKRLSTGIPIIDTGLKGGFPIGTITEICGPPGMGKTQFCMSCCVNILLNNLNNNSANSILYIDTELKFDSKRLIEMITNSQYLNNNTSIPLSESFIIDSILPQVNIFKPNTNKELFDELKSQSLLNTILNQNIQLIIIDSAAALIRKEGYSEKESSKLTDELVLYHIICNIKYFILINILYKIKF
jgi:RecA/RadA recombinase